MAKLLHIETLGGKPKIDGTLIPYPNNQAGLNPIWEPDHKIKRMFDFQTKIKERRWRAVFNLGWRGLSAEEYETILASIEKPSFEFIPRTQLPGQVEAENTYTVYCRSIIPFDAPMRLRGGGYDLDVELVSKSIIRERGGGLWVMLMPRIVRAYSKLHAPVYTRVLPPAIELVASIVRAYSKVKSPVFTASLPDLDEQLFWIARDGTFYDIFSSAIDGSDVQKFIDVSVLLGDDSVHAMCLDVASNLGALFFGTEGDNSIYRYDLDTGVNTLIIGPLANPISKLLVDEDAGYLFYLQSTSTEVIQTDLDGSNPVVITTNITGTHSSTIGGIYRPFTLDKEAQEVIYDYEVNAFVCRIRAVPYGGPQSSETTLYDNDSGASTAPQRASDVEYIPGYGIVTQDWDASNMYLIPREGGDENSHVAIPASINRMLRLITRTTGRVVWGVGITNDEAILDTALDLTDRNVILEIATTPELDEIRDVALLATLNIATILQPPKVLSYSRIFAPAIPTGDQLLPTKVSAFSRVFAPTVLSAPPVEMQVTIVRSTSRVIAPTYYAPTAIEISDPYIWLRASNLALIEDDQVDTWIDAGSKGGSFGRLEGSPRYRVNGIGGLPAVEFFALERFIDGGTNFEQEFTIVTVLQSDDLETRTQRVFWIGSTTSTANSSGALEFDNSEFRCRYGDGTNTRVTKDGILANDTPHVLMIRKKVGVAIPDFYVDGVLQTGSSVSGSATNPVTGNQNIYIGSLGVAGGGTKFDGMLAELDMWQRAITDDEVTNINAELVGMYI